MVRPKQLIIIKINRCKIATKKYELLHVTLFNKNHCFICLFLVKTVLWQHSVYYLKERTNIQWWQIWILKMVS